MENNKELKEVQENYKRVEQSIAQKGYYLAIKEPILEWSKDYHEHKEETYYYRYFFYLVRKVIVDQKLSRLQAYALVGLITDLLYSVDGMHEEVDNFIDNALFSRINGDGDYTDPIPFSDDPLEENPQHYAWSGKWRMWQESE